MSGTNEETVGQRAARLTNENRRKEAQITAKRQADLKATFSRIEAGPGTLQEKQLRKNKAQKESFAIAQKRVGDTVAISNYNRVEPHTQETVLKRDPKLQGLLKQGRITAPTNQPVKSTGASALSYPRAQADIVNPPGLENNVNKFPRIITEGSASPQVFDINSFRSEIINNDVLPSHSYLVTFSPFRLGFTENQPLTDFVTNKRNTLVMRCESIILPTPSLLEEENIRRYGYGPVEKIPYGVQFSDVSMTWLVDKKSEIVDFMHQWLNTIVMHDSPNAGMYQAGDPTDFRPSLNEYSPFEVGYKDAYANPIVRIYVYNRQNETVTEYEMFDVFPTNIQSMNLSWADENQVQKLTVNFAYTNMRVKAPQKTTAAQVNYMTEGMSNPYEERKQPDNKGGRAAADRSDSPVDEFVRISVNSSSPNSVGAGQQADQVGTANAPTTITRDLSAPTIA